VDSRVYATKNEVQRVANRLNENSEKIAVQVTRLVGICDTMMTRIEILEEEVKCLKAPLQ
jgi:hypothetical protein